jgi:hypothetical protein
VRGASALETELEGVPGKKVRLLVVWMPVLATDLGPPSTGTMARIPDRRASQYWDPRHAISKRLLLAARAHPEWLAADERVEVARPDFVVWDFVAIWKPGARWDAELPRPDYHGGPVVHVIDRFRDALLSFLQ